MKKWTKGFFKKISGFDVEEKRLQGDLSLARKTITNITRSGEKPKAIVLVDFENMIKSLEKIGFEADDISKGFDGICNFVRNITRGDGCEISYFMVFSPDSLAREAKGWLTHLYSTVDLIDMVPCVVPCPATWTMRHEYPKDVDSVDWRMTFMGIRLINDLRHVDRLYIVTGDWDFAMLKSHAEMNGVDCKILKVNKNQFALNYFRSWGGEKDVVDLNDFLPKKTKEA